MGSGNWMWDLWHCKRYVLTDRPLVSGRREDAAHLLAAANPLRALPVGRGVQTLGQGREGRLWGRWSARSAASDTHQC